MASPLSILQAKNLEVTLNFSLSLMFHIQSISKSHLFSLQNISKNYPLSSTATILLLAPILHAWIIAIAYELSPGFYLEPLSLNNFIPKQQPE